MQIYLLFTCLYAHLYQDTHIVKVLEPMGAEEYINMKKEEIKSIENSERKEIERFNDEYDKIFRKAMNSSKLNKENEKDTEETKKEAEKDKENNKKENENIKNNNNNINNNDESTSSSSSSSK